MKHWNAVQGCFNCHTCGCFFFCGWFTKQLAFHEYDPAVFHSGIHEFTQFFLPHYCWLLTVSKAFLKHWAWRVLCWEAFHLLLCCFCPFMNWNIKVLAKLPLYSQSLFMGPPEKIIARKGFETFLPKKMWHTKSPEEVVWEDSTRVSSSFPEAFKLGV